MKKADTLDLLVGGSSFADKVFEEHLKERKIVFNREVDYSIIEEVILQIIKFNKEDKDIPVNKRKPILMYIASGGGCAISGFALLDVMKQSKTPIHTIDLCSSYSMASYILMAGHKRFALKHASVLLHDGGFGLQGSANKNKDTIEFYNRLDSNIKNFVIENTNIEEELYDSKIDREWYIFPEEAKELGIIDYIVGVDVTLDEIM